MLRILSKRVSEEAPEKPSLINRDKTEDNDHLKLPAVAKLSFITDERLESETESQA
jgi:hypothetical protein